MSVPAYPAYKDSGVEWLGQVPTGWRVARIRELVQLINGYPFDAGQFTATEGLPLVRIRDLNASEAAVRFGGEIVEAALVTGADVLIGMDGDFNVGRWLGSGPALLNQRVCCLRGDPCVLRLLEHALPIPLQRINDLTYSTTVKHLSSGQVLDIRVALPGVQDELYALVAFLDRETGKIDALVEEQRRLIALLKEKRQAVISHAVTKGLNPQAPLKPSGIEWLGDVPAHWEIMRLRFITTVNPPKSEVANLPDETEVSFLPMETIGERGELDLSRTRSLGDVRTGYTYLTEGDVIFAKVTPCLENGKGALATGLEGGKAFATTEVTVLRPAQPGDGRFLWWLTSSKVFRGPAEGSMYGAGGLKRVSDHWVSDYCAPWPSKAERAAIAAFLDRETERTDELVEQAELGISLLQERRAALISAAVTGKIDVRGLVAARPLETAA